MVLQECLVSISKIKKENFYLTTNCPHGIRWYYLSWVSLDVCVEPLDKLRMLPNYQIRTNAHLFHFTVRHILDSIVMP